MLDDFPNYKQLTAFDCGPSCLMMVLKHFKITFSAYSLRSDFDFSKGGVSFTEIRKSAEKFGIDSELIICPKLNILDEITFPSIVWMNQGHFVVVYNIKNEKIFVSDPNLGKYIMSKEEFIDKSFDELNNSTFLTMKVRDSKINNKSSVGSSDKLLTNLLPYLFMYKREVLLIMFWIFVISFFQVLMPFITKAIVDNGINYDDIQFVTLVLVGQFVIFFSRSIFEILKDWGVFYIFSRVNLTIINDFLFDVISKPLSFLSNRSTGDFLQRVYDFERIKDFFSVSTLNMMVSILSLVTFSFVIIYFDLTIFFIYLVSSILYFGWTYYFLRKRKSLDTMRFVENSKVQDSLIDIISGIVDVKLFNSRNKVTGKWGGHQLGIIKVSSQLIRVNHFQTYGGRLIVEVQNILILFYSSKMVIEGVLTIGSFVSIQFIVGQLTLPIFAFIAFLQNYQDAKLSYDRICEIQDVENESSNSIIFKKPTDYSIYIKKLKFSYLESGFEIIVNSLEFKEGAKIAIVGESGSGKSTLIKLIAGFYSGYSGELFVGNINFKEVDLNKWRNDVGIVVSNSHVFDDTIIGNICLSEMEYEYDVEKVLEILDDLNLIDFLQSLPNGIYSKLGNAGIKLSSGQLQRLFLARAMYKKSKIFLLDEPTSSLDSITEQSVFEVLLKSVTNQTLIVVSHRLKPILNFDKIIVMDKGKIVEEGSHFELFSNNRFYRKLLESQGIVKI